MSLGRGLVIGAAAGAAGTTALNPVAYLDMAIRGRAASHTPENTVNRLASVAHISIPGDGEARNNRVAGLGPLTGLAAGVGVGACWAVLVGRGGDRAWWSAPSGQPSARWSQATGR